MINAYVAGSRTRPAGVSRLRLRAASATTPNPSPATAPSAGARCAGDSRFAAKPIVLSTPITIAGMSYGAINRSAKMALGRAATQVGISTTTGDGGMLMAEREASQQLVY